MLSSQFSIFSKLRHDHVTQKSDNLVMHQSDLPLFLRRTMQSQEAYHLKNDEDDTVKVNKQNESYIASLNKYFDIRFGKKTNQRLEHKALKIYQRTQAFMLRNGFQKARELAQQHSLFAFKERLGERILPLKKHSDDCPPSALFF